MQKTLKLTVFLIVLMSHCILTAQDLPERESIDSKYKWNLTDIYPNWEAWQKDYDQLTSMLSSMEEYKGKLSEGPEYLYRALITDEKINILFYKVYQYPHFLRDLDSRDQAVAGKFKQAQLLYSKYQSEISWVNPELLQIPWDTMKKWLDETPELAPYRFGIQDLYRLQTHVLDEEKEKILSYFSQANRSPAAIYAELSTTDIDFPKVTLSDENEVQMTHGNYYKTLATNRNQEDRKKAFAAYYGVFEKHKNTYAAIYNAVCQKDWAMAQARNFNSTLEAALEDNNIPVVVYENLVKTVKQNTAPLQKYLELRKKLLGLDEYHLYDGSIPVIDFDKNYAYEDAKKWVGASAKPLGEEYQQKMNIALAGGWIDVFETAGKRSGAYSSNVYGVHPYMLMNYNETLSEVFTLSHELGHTIHTLLANENQPYATHDYTIFVAEVASTLNERFLLDYLLSKSQDPKERIALIQQSISNITGTFYFQTMLADFEWQVHQMVEAGKPVTTDKLREITAELDSIYYGNAVSVDELYHYVWTRIPHFYRTPYYVYQYATCFASSAQIYQDMTTGSKKDRETAKERYLNMLKSGGSDYPMNQLKAAGVDLTKPETFVAVVDQFGELVDLLEEEIIKLNETH
jgi:oligoendopeptidase F